MLIFMACIIFDFPTKKVLTNADCGSRIVGVFFASQFLKRYEASNPISDMTLKCSQKKNIFF